MAQIVILSKRAKKVQKDYEAKGFAVIDVTSNSEDPTFQKFSPFYPHGNIPIPGQDGKYAESVEGIWQGLKVFQNEPIDVKKFKIKSMKNLKRPITEKRGKLLGHSYMDTTLGYIDARKKIYLPIYEYVLNNCLQNEVALLKGLLSEGKCIALLDYEVNENPNDTSKPLSHASLIKKYLQN